MRHNSTTRPVADKAATLKAARKFKQREKLPLLVHASLRWARKINQRLEYFGPVDPTAPDFGSSAAMAEYHRVADALQAGRRPRPKTDGVTVADVANEFLNWKRELRDNGELSPRSFIDHQRTCAIVVAAFGRDRIAADLAPDDFAKLRKSLAKTRGAIALSNEVQRTRSIFKFSYEAGLLDRPLRFGPQFKRPQAKVIRAHRHAGGLRMFEADEIHALLNAAGVQMRAMILLAINGGLGNSDLSLMPLEALDLDGRWLDWPRPKTAIPRRIPLWSETVDAIREWLDKRKQPKVECAEPLVFVTKRGGSWHKDTPDNPLSNEFAKLQDAIDRAAAKEAKERGEHPPPKMRRRGRGFYSLRHSFATVAGETLDQIAVDGIMGHVDASMAVRYRERIGDDRLRAVVEHVHAWLFSGGADAGGKGVER